MLNLKKRTSRLGHLILILLLLGATSALAQDDSQQGKFLGNIFNGLPDPIFDQYWNQVTPENAGKWGSVEAIRDEMIWSSLDLMDAYAQEQSIPVKHHTFIWGQQEPMWVANLPPEEQRAEVEEWMELFAERYPDVEMIDVVNEAQHDAPSFKDALGGDGETGWDWIIWSFEKARALYPDAILLINDYNILCCTGELEVYKEQISILHERGLLDGIGIQAHGLENILPSTIERNLDSLAEFGLPIYVSELELRESDDRAQLFLYQDVFPILWQHEAVVGVTLWGYKAGEMWRESAELINWYEEERLALQWLEKYLEYDQLINAN